MYAENRSRPESIFAERLCAYSDPAEADMIKTLALFQIFGASPPPAYYEPRLRRCGGWAFYDKLIYEFAPSDPDFLTRFIDTVAELEAENPFSLRKNAQFAAKDKKIAPYHPACDYLPVLLGENGVSLDTADARLVAVWNNAANIALSYKAVTSLKKLTADFDALFSAPDGRGLGDRLAETTVIKTPADRALFPELNGQRSLFARCDLPAGTVLGLVSGDAGKIGDKLPPVLCSWPYARYRNRLSFWLRRNFPYSYIRWIDSYVIGNRLKLVNSCCPNFNGIKPLTLKIAPSFGNVGCFFGHFSSPRAPRYFTLPFYMAIKDIKAGEELFTFYALSDGMREEKHEYC